MFDGDPGCCSECTHGFEIPSGLDPPESGLCMTCSDARVVALEAKLAKSEREVRRLCNSLTEARSMVDGADLSWLLSRCPACGHEMRADTKADSCPQCSERFKAHWHYNYGAGHTPEPPTGGASDD